MLEEYSIILIKRNSRQIRVDHLSQDPTGVFGGLLQACIREDEVENRGGIMKEDIAFFVLGIVSSTVTTYFLFQTGIVV